MAVLSKIRERSVLLILVIGFCLLAFIIGDLFNSGGLGMPSRYVGSVNGKDILVDEFLMKKSQYEQQGMSPTQAATQVWNQEVNLAIMNEQFENLGFRVGESHIVDGLKNDPELGQNQLFLNALGQFDFSKFKEFFASNPGQEAYIENKENNIVLNAKYRMYIDMVRAASFTTDLEGKIKYEAQSDKVTFDYVPVLFSTVKDSEVELKDEEIVAYMKKYPKRFKSEENREFEFVVFEDKASAEDEAAIRKNIEIITNGGSKNGVEIPAFATVESTQVADFVNEHSDVPFDETYIPKNNLPTEHAEGLFNLAAGEVYGPYTFGDFYCVSRSMGKTPGGNAKASHILIAFDGTNVPGQREARTKEEAQAKAESLLAQAKANPAGFAALATANSEDQGSAVKGGDLGFFGKGQMVPTFNDYVFNNSIGSIGLVESNFGFHVIYITDKEDAVQLATIAQRIQASEETSNSNFQKASKFEMDAEKGNMAELAKTANVTVMPARVRAYDESFGGIANQRQIVQWVFNKSTSKGDVSRFSIANLGEVVVKVKNINPEGLMAVSEARPLVETTLKNEKKAELIKAKIKGATLNDIAAATGSQVQTIANVTIEQAMLPNVGPEPKVVAQAIKTGAGKVSAPIVGQMGVYVVQAQTVDKAPALQNHVDFVNRLKGTKQSYSSRFLPVLLEKAEIEDNRSDLNL